MKYNKERLETMGFEPGRDLCLVRVRPDDWDRVDKFLTRGNFPYLYDLWDEGNMEHTVVEYFFDTTDMKKEIIKDFPFKNDEVLGTLVCKAAVMGLMCLKEKFKETLFNKIKEKVFEVLSKKDRKEEVATITRNFSRETTEEAGTNIDLPEKTMIKAGIKMIERIIKSNALTILDWEEKNSGYQDDVLSFDDFEQDYEHLLFTARAKGDPVKRLSIITSDADNEDLYISWTILRDGTDLEAEDGVKLETWTAHKGRVYNREGMVYNKETGTFDFPPLEKIGKEEWEIINEEMNLTEENFRQSYLWEE